MHKTSKIFLCDWMPYGASGFNVFQYKTHIVASIKSWNKMINQSLRAETKDKSRCLTIYLQILLVSDILLSFVVCMVVTVACVFFVWKIKYRPIVYKFPSSTYF